MGRHIQVNTKELLGFDNAHILHSRSVQGLDRDHMKSTKDVATIDYHQADREAIDTTQELRKKQNYRCKSSHTVPDLAKIDASSWPEL